MSTPTRPVLVTIAPSHYCEKARWALERAGVDYEERAHLPMLHWAFVLPRTRGASRTVPLLVKDDGVLGDSRAILAWADAKLAPGFRLFPDDPAARGEVEALAATFDDRLGPLVRRYAYCHLLERPALLDTFFAPRLSPIERAALPLVRPALVAALRRAFRPSERAMDRLETKLRALFDETSARLGPAVDPSAPDVRYLAAGRLTAADVGLVCLAGPLLFVPEYGATLPTLDAVPPRFRAFVEELRATPAGKHLLATSARHRRERVA